MEEFFVIFLLMLDSEHVQPQVLNVNGEQTQGPKEFGVLTEGYVSLAADALLNQQCLHEDPPLCGEILGGVMSAVIISTNAKLIQSPESVLSCGNYSYITLDYGCTLDIGKQSEIRPNIEYGGGRIEIYCNSSHWTMDEGTYINLDRQSKVIVQADFAVGTLGLVKMEPASTLEIYYPFTMEHLVWLTLNKNSRFVVQPNAKGVISISSSNIGMTMINLQDSSTVSVGGDFTVGKGIDTVTMTVGTSGSLIVTTNGDFEVEAAVFEISPSSFWQIDGEFVLDKTSTFSSGMQSNLTIGGSMSTVGGGLRIGAFSSLVVKGTCENKAGTLETSEFSQLTIGPTNPQGTVGVLSLLGGSLILQQASSASVTGVFTNKGTTGLNQGAYIEVAGRMDLNSGSVTLDEHSTLFTNGSLSISAGLLMLQKLATLNIEGSFINNGYANLGRGSLLQIEGHLQCDGSIELGEYSTLQTAGSLHVFPGSKVSIGGHSLFNIPGGVTVTTYPGTQFVMGVRSSVTFIVPEICSLLKDFVVPDFANVTITHNTPGIMCFHFA